MLHSLVKLLLNSDLCSSGVIQCDLMFLLLKWLNMLQCKVQCLEAQPVTTGSFLEGASLWEPQLCFVAVC